MTACPAKAALLAACVALGLSGCVGGKAPLRAYFSPTEFETVAVDELADAKAEFAFEKGILRVEARADAPDRAVLAFSADPAVGSYVRYFVPTGCRPVVKLNGVVHDGVMPGRTNMIWRMWADGDRLELDFSAKAAQAAAPASDRAAWMRGRYGLMVHWLYPSYGDADRWTDAFDLESFLSDFSRTGADWLIFTAGQCRGVYCSPNKRFAELCGTGHSSKRDLLLEVARGVKRLGKRFIVYTACDFVKDGCRDHSVQRGLCWDNSSEDRREFQARWASVLREWSLKLGENCDGWWLDGLGTKYPHGVDFATWEKACRAGNPKSAVAFNQGGNMFASYGPSDYAAGETTSLKWATIDLDAPPPIDAMRHYLFPVDGYWGAFWAWPDGEWSGIGHLRATRPELFSQAALDARLAAGNPVEPIYGASELKSFMDKLVKAGGAATVNVGIMPNGRLNPHSVELIRSAMLSDRKQEKQGGMQ